MPLVFLYLNRGMMGSSSQNTIVSLVAGNSYSPCFSWQGSKLYLRVVGNSGFSFVKFAYVGTVSGLSKIETAPSEGWIGTTSWEHGELPLVDNGGYVITYTFSGKAHYVRLFITINYSAAGDQVGINYQFQEFVPTNI